MHFAKYFLYVIMTMQDEEHIIMTVSTEGKQECENRKFQYQQLDYYKRPDIQLVCSDRLMYQGRFKQRVD